MGSISVILIIFLFVVVLYVANCIAKTSINTKKICQQNEQIIQLLYEISEK